VPLSKGREVVMMAKALIPLMWASYIAAVMTTFIVLLNITNPLLIGVCVISGILVWLSIGAMMAEDDEYDG